MGPLHGPVTLRQPGKLRFGHILEHRERVGDIRGGDAAAPLGLPSSEELLEHAVQKLSPLLCREAGLLVALLGKLEDVRGKVL